MVDARIGLLKYYYLIPDFWLLPLNEIHKHFPSDSVVVGVVVFVCVVVVGGGGCGG